MTANNRKNRLGRVAEDAGFTEVDTWITKVLANNLVPLLEHREHLAPAHDRIEQDFDRLITELCFHPEQIYNLSPRGFEELVAEIWFRLGYQVELTPQTRDGGRDVVATRFSETRSRVLIECKKYGPSEAVGIDVVQRLLGVVFQYDATSRRDYHHVAVHARSHQGH